MAVLIEKWAQGMEIPCEVKLSTHPQYRYTGSDGLERLEAYFTILYKEEEIAQGYCYVPAQTMAEIDGTTISSEARIEPVANLLGSSGMGVTDFKIGSFWLSQIAPTKQSYGGVLHPLTKDDVPEEE